MKIEDLLPYVLPSAKGCPDAAATTNIRLAVIELCKRALIWREQQPPQPTADGVTAYTYMMWPEQEIQMVRLFSATLGGAEVGVVDPAIGKLRDAAGYCSPYIYGGLSGFELRPAQAPNIEIITYGAVAPSLTGECELPDDLQRYAEAIAHGALYRLKLTPKRDYSDAQEGQFLRALFEEEVRDARSDASRGFARVVQRTKPMWF